MATVEALRPDLVRAKPARGLWGNAFARKKKNMKEKIKKKMMKN